MKNNFEFPSISDVTGGLPLNGVQFSHKAGERGQYLGWSLNTPPKFEHRYTENDALDQVSHFQRCLFWVSMANFAGVYTIFKDNFGAKWVMICSKKRATSLRNHTRYSTWICLRCLEKVKHILPNGGLWWYTLKLGRTWRITLNKSKKMSPAGT